MLSFESSDFYKQIMIKRGKWKIFLIPNFKSKILEPSIKTYFFMDSLLEVPLILIFYIVFVLKLGPEFIKTQPPLSLKFFMIVYNILQILANFVLLILVLYTSIKHFVNL